MRSGRALAVLVASLALAAPAGAQVVTLREHPHPALARGPQLAGERVAWSQTACIDDCDRGDDRDERFEVFSASGAGPARRLFRARVDHESSGPSFFTESYSFALSEQVLVTAHHTLRGDEVEGESGGAELRAGAPGGPRALLVDCSVGFFRGVALFALDGGRLAYDTDPCDDSAGYVVRDLATGASQALPESATGDQLSLRGNFAAWLEEQGEGLRLVVYDLAAGATAYAAPADGVVALDLDADGSVAAVAGIPPRPCRTGRLLSYSVARPSPTEVPVRVCATAVRIDSGAIVFLGWDGFARTLRRLAPDGGVADLVRFVRVRAGDFDAEAGRLAWTARNCGGGMSIFTATLAQLPQRAGSANCPARVRSGVVPVRRGRATVMLACPRGCSGTLELRGAGERDFALLRGESRVRVPLGPRARARLTRRGSLQAIARLVWRNRAGDRLARLRAVTLVARRG